MDPSMADRIIQLALVRGPLSAPALENVRRPLAEAAERRSLSTDAERLLEELIRQNCLEESYVRRLAQELGGPESGGSVLPEGQPDRSTLSALGEGLALADRTLGELALPLDPLFRQHLESWDRYRILRHLGHGGMGEVFQAEDPRVRRTVAIKFLHKDELELVERFLQEARLQAKIEHGNVCRIFEVGDLAGRPYIVMQFIDGQTLGALRADLTLEQKTRLLARVAEALHAAHKEGLIHRDIKPGNIMVEHRPDGSFHPFVVDFGLARELNASGLTVSGALIGTPAYMSPEQARGTTGGQDRRTDIYSLGATLYDLLAGRPPFAEPTTLATILRILRDDPPPLRRLAPEVPADLHTIVMKCLEKDPDRRYDSAFTLARDLDAFLEGEPILARPPSLRERVVKLARRHWTLSAVALALCMAALLFGGYLVWERVRIQAQARMAAEFGRSVNAVEQMLRVARFAPRHDLTPENSAAGARLKELEHRVDALGGVASGPGHYYLGQGFLSLREYPKARHYLELAWAEGYRGGEVAYALGQALGALYMNELSQISRIPGKELRESRYRDAERTLSRPALHFLGQANRDAMAVPEYAEAMIAFCQQRWDEALRLCARATERAPWFYEARSLQGMIHIRRVEQGLTRGDLAAVRKNLELAGAAYGEVVHIARSAPEGYLGLADSARWRMIMEASQSGAVQEAFAEAMAASRLAAEISPLDAGIWTQRSELLWRLAEHQTGHGGDPTEAFSGAIEAAQTAVRCAPANSAAHADLGLSYWRKAEWEMLKGVDAVPTIGDCVRALQHSLASNPSNTIAHNGLGLAFWTLGEIEFRRGEDPRPNLETALRHLEQVSRLNPGLAVAHSNRGGIYNDIVAYHMSHGLDPSVPSAAAADACRKAIARNPSMIPPYLNLASTLLREGGYMQQLNRDPRPFLNEAITTSKQILSLNPKSSPACGHLGVASLTLAYQDMLERVDPTSNLQAAVTWFRRAQELNPSGNNAFVQEGRAHNLLAQGLLERGLDPRAELRQARSALERARRNNPRLATVYRELAESELAEARWAMRGNRPPEAAFDLAERLAGQSIALNPDYADAYHTRAQIRRHRADWEWHRRRAAAGWIERGLQDAERTREIDPEQYEAQALRGALLLLRAQTESDPGRSRRTLAEAIRDLEAAQPKAPFLDRSLENLLPEARRRMDLLPAAPPGR